MMKKIQIPRLAIVVPCFNEEAVFSSTEKKLRDLMLRMEAESLVKAGSKVVYVDDGSNDSTWELVDKASEDYPEVDSGVKLAHNAGHQNALLAGLDMVKDSFDAVITIDADLQDDIEAIPKMVKEYLNGSEIVYGVRESRDTDTRFKRGSATAFYKLMGKLGVETVYNHADFRLLSARAVKELLRYKEHNIYLRGVVPRIGLKQSKVYYARKAREAGESKYPLKKMLNFAAEGITSFSIKPVRMVFALGLAFLCIAVIIFIYTMVRYFRHDVIEGWTSLMLSIWFCTGVLLMGIGIIGEYVGKIFLEVKERPRYVIEEKKGCF